MFEKRKMDLVSTGRLLLVFLVACIAGWVILNQAEKAVHLSLESEKELEINELFNAITMYEIKQNAQPENPNRPTWCRAGQVYNKDVCLKELTGVYFPTGLPVSPDDNAYVYFKGDKVVDRERIIFASQKYVDKQKCSTDKTTIWCVGVEQWK